MSEEIWQNSLVHFRNSVAAATPTPGGGAVAAVAATLAAALLRMVCGISRKSAPSELLDQAATRVQVCEEKLAELAEEDSRAFEAYLTARRNAKDGPGPSLPRDLLLECARVPLEAAEQVQILLLLIEEIRPVCAPRLASDLATSGYLLGASRSALLENVDINLNAVEDCEQKRTLQARQDGLWNG